MQEQHDEAWVLSTFDLGESDRIITLLAQHHGKLRAAARGARRSQRRFAGSLEPLTRVRAAWVERRGGDLHALTAADCLHSYAAMQAEPRTQAACAVLAEIATTFAQEGQADPRGFRLLGACLDALEAGGETWIVVRYYELWTLRLQGLLPELQHCAVCAEALPLERSARVAPGLGICCDPCGRGVPGETRRLGGAERRFLDAAVRRPPCEIVEGGGARLQSGTGLDLLLRGTLEGFIERPLRTYRHLVATTAA